MPDPRHLALVDAWVQRIQDVGIVRALDELATDDLVLENATHDSDLEGLRQRWVEFARAFPDAEASVEEVISDGDRLVLVLDMVATHSGPLRTIPATGLPVHFNVAIVMALQGDRVKRFRSYPEFYTVMEQLGVFPPFEG